MNDIYSVILTGYVLAVLTAFTLVNHIVKTFYQHKLNRARRSYKEWKKVRVVAAAKQCPYATSLILEMIVAYKALLYFNYVTDREYLAYLYSLLEKDPPKQDPPSAGPF